MAVSPVCRNAQWCTVGLSLYIHGINKDLVFRRVYSSLPDWVVIHSSFSRMRVIYHNWSATKQHPHLQSVAEISRHSVLSGDRIQQCETSSVSRHKDTDQSL